jgi:hypothetical protein
MQDSPCPVAQLAQLAGVGVGVLRFHRRLEEEEEEEEEEEWVVLVSGGASDSVQTQWIPTTLIPLSGLPRAYLHEEDVTAMLVLFLGSLRLPLVHSGPSERVVGVLAPALVPIGGQEEEEELPLSSLLHLCLGGLEEEKPLLRPISRPSPLRLHT